MTAPRDRRWLSIHGLLGGFGMFAAEALVVLGFALVAWVLSVVILTVL